ncbi:hypothetical protein [Bacillus sp. FJAT-26390]|uniref:hypothetical protein n=1 Tax=Bacillus sp. FJAT-26390 TaxID=1743142 RepID=UPI000807BC66|nr:hypothetical protein [Bacillus sp. FJAT-26390]OBZ17309.1 hypothetical protein A7975_05390 [Bacillus sp. FJAT-26390]
MKKHKKTILLSLIGLFIVLVYMPVLISYANYRSIKVNNENTDQFIHHLEAVVRQKDSFEMTEVTTFDWDQMYMFPPYFSREEMRKATGTKWTTETSYLAYLANEFIMGDFPLLDESVHQLVFVKGDEVVLDVVLDRFLADFTASDRRTEREQSAFVIQKTEDHFKRISNAN